MCCVAIKNMEDGFHVEFNHPMMENKLVDVKTSIYCKHIVEDIVIDLEKIIQDKNFHDIKKYTEINDKFNEEACDLFFKPVFDDFVDRVRRRPAVIFGSADKSGAINVVKSLVSELLPFCEKIHLDIDTDGYISLIAENMHVYKIHTWRLKCRKGKQDLIEMCKAVTDELTVNVDVDGKLEKQIYKHGKHIDTEYLGITQFDRKCVSLTFKISKEVFTYEHITERDLKFIRIGVD